MKTNLSFIITIVFLLFVSDACAANNVIPKINLSWTSSATNVNQFKFYFASSSDMLDKKWHKECTVPAEKPVGSGSYSMTCTNVPISVYPAYISIVGVLGDQSEIASNVQEIASEPINVPDILDITLH